MLRFVFQDDYETLGDQDDLINDMIKEMHACAKVSYFSYIYCIQEGRTLNLIELECLTKSSSGTFSVTKSPAILIGRFVTW